MKSPYAARAQANSHPKAHSGSSGAIMPIEAGVLSSALNIVKKHPVYSMLGASAFGLAVGYFIRSKK